MSAIATIEDVLSGVARWCVIHGKCEIVMAGLPAKCIDVGFHDPPYSKAVHARSIRRTYLPDVADQPCRKVRAHDFGFDHLTPELQRECAQQWARITKRWTIPFSDTELAHSWREELTAAKLDFVRYGFWVKDRAMPQISGDRPGSRVEQLTIAHAKGRKRWNGGGLGNVWQYPVVVNCNGHRSDRIHTAQKPLELVIELLELFTDTDDVVLDSFAGSATTGVACLRLGRRFVGIEKDAVTHGTAVERMLAEERGSTLSAARAGQTTLFDRLGGMQ